jgi:hypothetical protein
MALAFDSAQWHPLQVFEVLYSSTDRRSTCGSERNLNLMSCNGPLARLEIGLFAPPFQSPNITTENLPSFGAMKSLMTPIAFQRFMYRVKRMAR